MSEPNVTITIKRGGGFADPWIVIRGLNPDETKRMVAETFGVPEQETLGATVINANASFQGVQLVASELGGTVVAEDIHAGPAKKFAGQVTAEELDVDQAPSLADLIEKCGSVAELRALYAERKDEFLASESATHTWKLRGRALSGK